jgi:hypothetical protein
LLKVNKMTEPTNNTALVVAIVVIVIIFILIVVFACMGIQNHMSQTQCISNNGSVAGDGTWWRGVLTRKRKGNKAEKRVRFVDAAVPANDPVSDDSECPVTQLLSKNSGFEKCDASSYKCDNQRGDAPGIDPKRLFPLASKSDGSQKAGDTSQPDCITYDKLRAAYKESNGILMGQCNTRDKLRNRNSLEMGLRGRGDTVQMRLDQVREQKLNGTYECVQFNESPYLCGDQRECDNRYCD